VVEEIDKPLFICLFLVLFLLSLLALPAMGADAMFVQLAPGNVSGRMHCVQIFTSVPLSN
jgi:hypothetical protein